MNNTVDEILDQYTDEQLSRICDSNLAMTLSDERTAEAKFREYKIVYVREGNDIVPDELRALPIVCSLYYLRMGKHYLYYRVEQIFSMSTHSEEDDHFTHTPALKIFFSDEAKKIVKMVCRDVNRSNRADDRKTFLGKVDYTIFRPDHHDKIIYVKDGISDLEGESEYSEGVFANLSEDELEFQLLFAEFTQNAESARAGFGRF